MVSDAEPREVTRPRRRWLKPLILVVVSLLVAWIVVGFIGAIDWAEVASAFGRLSIASIAVLVLGLLVRQAFNAVPLAQFVDQLSWRRSVQNDLGANVVGTFAPPPADVVLRVSMFNSWGINPVDGMAGVTLNMLTFYAVRFFAPLLGVLVLAVQGVERGQVVTALSSGLVSLAVIGGLIAVMRGDAMAAWVGRTAARVVNRVREGADEQEWALAVVDFRGRMNDTLRAGLIPSLLALVAMVLSDSAILLLALRSVGIGAEQLSVIDVIGAFLIAYPLTLMPLAGLGILDAALLAAYTEIAGLPWEAEIVAALVVWRTITILGPLALGALTVVWWRRTTARSAAAAGTT
jgi:putative heme transporter